MASTSSTTYNTIPAATASEDQMRQQWAQALGYMNPMLAQMWGYMDPSLYGQYTGIAGLQGAQALGELQSQPQIQTMLQQMQQAQQAGLTDQVTQLQQQLAQIPGGQNALMQYQTFQNALATSQGQLPQLSPEAQAQITQLGQSYETTGMNDVSRARENALRQWGENTAQRGMRQSDTPSQAAWAPVEAELARQTGNVGAGRAALESQTTLNFAQQMPQQAAQLAAYQQQLAQSAQQNRSQLGQASAAPYQNMFSGVQNAGSSFNPFTQQLGNLRIGQSTQSTYGNSNLPWTSQLSGVGQGLAGFGQAMPYLMQAGKAVGSLPNLWDSPSWW
jgi:hypothetical protein